jgi:hypothetical protein
MQFRWVGPENFFVGDAGGEGTRMSRLVDHYECSEFGGKIKDWTKRGWIEIVDDGVDFIQGK